VELLGFHHGDLLLLNPPQSGKLSKKDFLFLNFFSFSRSAIDAVNELDHIVWEAVALDGSSSS
jgi:hypothetical protein